MNLKPTKYLYDCEPQEFGYLNYVDAINYKLEKAKSLYRELLEQENKMLQNRVDYDSYQELRKRCMAVEKAVKFNEELLKELGE